VCVCVCVCDLIGNQKKRKKMEDIWE